MNISILLNEFAEATKLYALHIDVLASHFAQIQRSHLRDWVPNDLHHWV